MIVLASGFGICQRMEKPKDKPTMNFRATNNFLKTDSLYSERVLVLRDCVPQVYGYSCTYIHICM